MTRNASPSLSSTKHRLSRSQWRIISRTNLGSIFAVLTGLLVATSALGFDLGTNRSPSHYYGSEFIPAYDSGKYTTDEALEELHFILTKAHIVRPGEPDQIVSSCDKPAETKNESAPLLIEDSSLKESATSDYSSFASIEPLLSAEKPARCRTHKSIGYDRAKQVVFGTLFLNQEKGGYSLTDVYCERTYTDSDFGGKETVIPGWSPPNADLVNTEHTWPQSRFTTRFPKDVQKADLHHLYPTDSRMNSSRSSFRFGYVDVELDKLKCPTARLGHPFKSSEIVFEAPPAHRGNVARSIFYFAVRYQMKISDAERETLIDWHRADPVDEAEQRRNDIIEQAQGNRNPFIDYPHLIGLFGGK